MIETEVWTSFSSRFIKTKKMIKINKMISESLTNGMKRKKRTEKSLLLLLFLIN